MTTGTTRLMRIDVRPIVRYALFCIAAFAGVSLIAAMMDGKSALAVARSTYQGAASGVGFTLMMLGYIVGLEHAKERLRREFQYRYPIWRPAVVRIGLALAAGTAVLWFAGDMLGDLLRGVWDWKWDLPRIARGSLKTALVGAFIAAALVAYEAHSLERRTREKHDDGK